MKISKNTWHYKFYNFFSHDKSPTLCQYMRTIFFGFIVAALGVMISLMVITLLLYPIVVLVFGLEITNDGDAVFFSGVFSWVVVMLYFFIVKLVPKLLTRSNKPKKPSIIIEYIKAKKNKYCPMIDFEE